MFDSNHLHAQVFPPEKLPAVTRPEAGPMLAWAHLFSNKLLPKVAVR